MRSNPVRYIMKPTEANKTDKAETNYGTDATRKWKTNNHAEQTKTKKNKKSYSETKTTRIK